MSTSERIPVLRAIEIMQAEGGLKLLSAGTSYKSLCPFHEEKTPSFFITKQNALWHCFGCGEKGDVIRFVQLISKISDFPELLKYLDNKYQTDLFDQGSQLKSETSSALFKLNEYAANYYHQTLLNILRTQKHHPIKTYLIERGITENSIEAYMLGYGGDSRKHLWEHLTKSSEFSDKSQFIESGLFYEYGKDKEVGDRFSRRLIFPIRKEGRVVSFSGRAIGEKDVLKYINGRTNYIFQKSHCLYGWDEAQPTVADLGRAIVVEGYLDAISLAQIGLRNTSALMGLTCDSKQIQIIKRKTNRVLFFIDNDEAGFRALIDRILPIAIAEEMQCRIVNLPDEIRSQLSKADPDELCRKFQTSAAEIIEENQYRVEDFLWNELLKKAPRNPKKTERERFQNLCISTFATVFRMGVNPARQATLIDFLSEKIQVPSNLISIYFVDETKYTALKLLTSQYEGVPDIEHLGAEATC
jgi:DNA primase